MSEHMGHKFTRGRVTVRKPHFRDVEVLEDRLDPFFVQECRMHGMTPRKALKQAITGLGCSWTFCDDGVPCGIFGWSLRYGTIYSLWKTLTPRQSRILLAECEPWVQHMVRQAKRPLWNMVWAENQRTIRWLEATDCFDFTADHGQWKRFETKAKFNV